MRQGPAFSNWLGLVCSLVVGRHQAVGQQFDIGRQGRAAQGQCGDQGANLQGGTG